MAEFILDPVPTDGGVFNLTSQRFDWCALSDDKFLIVYQQNNPTRLYAQVVNFNGINPPSFSDAYAVTSAGPSNMCPRVVAINNKVALITHTTTEPADTATTLVGFTIHINDNNEITILSSATVLTTSMRMDYYNIALHKGTNTVRFVWGFRTSATFYRSERIIVSLDEEDLGSITYFPFTQNALSPNTRPILYSLDDGRVFSNISGRLMIQKENQSGMEPPNVDFVFSASNNVASLMNNDTIVGSLNNNLISINVPTSVVSTIPNVFSGPRYFMQVIDEQHCLFASNTATPGSVSFDFVRVVDGQNVILNPNNPITIPNGNIDVAGVNGRNTPFYITSAKDRIHYTGIVDDGNGGTTIGFRILTV